MMGYWNNEEATKEVIIEPGTFRTGDLGKLTDGYLSITGRVKSQFKLENGKYVAPLASRKPSPSTRWLSSVWTVSMLHTFLIAHPNMEALRAALKGAGIAAGDDAALCKLTCAPSCWPTSRRTTWWRPTGRATKSPATSSSTPRSGPRQRDAHALVQGRYQPARQARRRDQGHRLKAV